MNDKKSKNKFHFKDQEKLTQVLHDSSKNTKFFKKRYILKKSTQQPIRHKRFKKTNGFSKVKRIKSSDIKNKKSLKKPFKQEVSKRPFFYKTRKRIKKGQSVANTFNEIDQESNSEDETASSYLIKALNKPAKKVGYHTKQGLQNKLLKKNGFTNNQGTKKYFKAGQSKGKASNFAKKPKTLKAKTINKTKLLAEKAIARSIAIAKSIVTSTITFISALSIPLIALVLGVLLIVVLFSMFLVIHQEQCAQPSYSDSTITENTSNPPKSIDDFIKSHKEAYILSWKAGGFLPSASIAQTMVENGFNFTNPQGTSLWQAHNMGGVKTSRKDDFPVTLASFGADSVDLTGTKAGTNVGDGTGGGYAWFKDYNAGIVGKAEFMAHQSLYRGAINNTDGKATLMAIANGGWATDPNYLTSLLSAYNSIGQKYQWLDREAIEKHGEKPYQANSLLDKKAIPNMPTKEETSQGLSEAGCVVNQNPSGEATGTNSAPTLQPPKEYDGKLKLPAPDNKNYAGNNYPFGQCTWGAYNRMAQLGHSIEWFSGNGGNGGFWWQSAQAKGYTVVKGKPQVGWAVSFTGGLAGSDPQYGHIAVVEYVNEDGSFLVSETNVVSPSSGTRSWRVINKATANQAYFIQGKG